MKHIFTTAIAALLLSGCAMLNGKTTSPDDTPPPTIVDTTDTVDKVAKPAAPIETKDSERKELISYCARTRLENPTACACEADATAKYANKDEWDDALVAARTGEKVKKNVDFDTLPEAEQTRMMSMMEATFSCYPATNEAIIAKTCTDAGNDQNMCNCMATGMKETFSTSTYLKTASAMSRGEDVSDLVPNLSESERVDVEKMDIIGKTCTDFGGWPGVEQLGQSPSEPLNAD